MKEMVKIMITRAEANAYISDFLTMHGEQESCYYSFELDTHGAAIPDTTVGAADKWHIIELCREANESEIVVILGDFMFRGNIALTDLPLCDLVELCRVLREWEMEDVQFQVGQCVMWNDPAISDYPTEEREMQRSIVWTIDMIEDDIITISNDYGSQAEVYARELSPA